MKDKIFFIFIILCLMTSAIVADNKHPFCLTDTGTKLLYQIDDQEQERYYFHQTPREIENHDSISIVHYTVQLVDDKKEPVASPFSLTTSVLRNTVNLYPANFMHIRKNEAYRLVGPGFVVPASLAVGEELPAGEMTVQQSSLQTRICRKNRKVTALTRLKVPAGSFVCYKIESSQFVTCMGQTTRYQAYTWYSPGIGIVKSEIYRENGKLAGRQLLVSLIND